jgi:hypothetical protein
LPVLYSLGLLGAPSPEQATEVERLVAENIAPFGLGLREQVAWHLGPPEPLPVNRISAAVAYFGALGASTAGLDELLSLSVPIVPVVSTLSDVRGQLPAALHPFNALSYDSSGPLRVATALLECAGLLPRQRRVFVSYRRDEARQAALQVFDVLSSRVFDVFLDTHDVSPGDDVQATVWHRLCDSDVLVMLDTPRYFESRWTDAEFGRALAKGISVLRVGWPDATPSSRTATASRVELLPEELDAAGHVAAVAIERIAIQVEALRSESHAVRSLNMLSALRRDLNTIGGSVAGVGVRRAVYMTLPGGQQVTAYPAVGVPTSRVLHDAAVHSAGGPAAVLFDPIGLRPEWLEHLDWLGQHVPSVRWLKATQLGWDLAGWSL